MKKAGSVHKRRNTQNRGFRPASLFRKPSSASLYSHNSHNNVACPSPGNVVGPATSMGVVCTPSHVKYCEKEMRTHHHKYSSDETFETVGRLMKPSILKRAMSDVTTKKPTRKRSTLSEETGRKRSCISDYCGARKSSGMYVTI